MTYITGDTHRDFRHIVYFCDTVGTRAEDILIILGDAGINYFGGQKDREFKRMLSELPVTLFCIHGNHEQRPSTLPGYRETTWRGGVVYREKEYPNLLFARDGEFFDFDGRQCLAIGGAYSVDKTDRLENNWGWWPDEQPSEAIRRTVEARLDELGNRVNVVLSHTCPLKYEPVEVFLPGIDQSMVDKSTERGWTPWKTGCPMTAGIAPTTTRRRPWESCDFCTGALCRLNSIPETAGLSVFARGAFSFFFSNVSNMTCNPCQRELTCDKPLRGGIT